MNKEERVKIAFEALSKIVGYEIKPNKAFYSIINDVRFIYKVDENFELYCRNFYDDNYRMSGYRTLDLFNSKIN